MSTFRSARIIIAAAGALCVAWAAWPVRKYADCAVAGSSDGRFEPAGLKVLDPAEKLEQELSSEEALSSPRVLFEKEGNATENQKGKLQEDYDAFPSSLEGNNKTTASVRRQQKFWLQKKFYFSFLDD